MGEVCPLCAREPAFVGRLRAQNRYCGFFEGNEPVLRGSGIIIPWAHRETVFDLTPEEWQATYELLQQAKRLMTAELRPDGFNVGWNCYPVGGQFIPHAHLHVIPRFADEPYAGKGIRHWLKQEANLRPVYRGRHGL